MLGAIMADFPAYPVGDVGVGDFKTGIGFTPSTWPVGTVLTLCNVEWDSDYRDVIFWPGATPAERAQRRDNYFSRLPGARIVSTTATYCKPGEPVKVNLPYAEAYTYNYLIVENPALPVGDTVTPPKLFYFVQQASMSAPSTTLLYLQLDVWTTYAHLCDVTRAFVERGHVALHAYTNGQRTSADVNELKRRYLLAPEGLDVGNSYIETFEEAHNVGDGWVFVVVSAAHLRKTASQSWGDLFGTVTNPKLPTARGMSVDGFGSACEMYAIPDITNFLAFVTALTSYPWISSQILSITAVPAIMCDVFSPVTTDTIPGGLTPSKPTAYNRYIGGANVTMSLESFLDKGSISGEWAAHPKSRVWPFSYVRVDNYCSQPLILKPEQFLNDTVTFGYMGCCVPPFQRLSVIPNDYGTAQPGTNRLTSRTPDGDTLVQDVRFGENMANALYWQDFPQLSILNDSYTAYLASNAHSLAYQRDYAGWALDKSLAASQTSYDNANRSIAAATENQQLAYETQRDISRLSMGNLVGNQLRDVYNNLSGGTQAGVNQIFGGADVSAIINTTVNAATGATANEVGNLQFQTSRAAQQGNIDANYQLQRWAARGDYAQSIAGIDASVQDAQMLPPTISNTFGGGMAAFLGARGLFAWYIKACTVTHDVGERIAAYWDRFGYAVGEYIDIGHDWLLTESFTYWKCQDTVLATSTQLEEGVKAVIRGVFEKGVTIWASPAILGQPYSSVAGVSDNYPDLSIPALY